MTEKSAFYVEPKHLTRLDDLRERLDNLERMIGKLEKMGPRADPLQIPVLLDQAMEILDELKKDGKEPKEEVGSLDDLLNQLRKRKALFLKLAGGPAALQRARAGINPAPERWWWYLDQAVAEERKRSLIRFFRGVIILAVVLLVLVFVYQRFLAPSPQLIAKLNWQDQAQASYNQGNPEAALQEVNNGLSYDPNDTDLLLLKGIILQKLGRNAEADQVFAQAESVFGNQRDFLLGRSQKYLTSGEIDKAMADAQQVIKIDPNSPEAYLYLGEGYEYQQKYTEAINSYEEASKLASQQNQAALDALIRMRLAVLMQRVSGQ